MASRKTHRARRNTPQQRLTPLTAPRGAENHETKKPKSIRQHENALRQLLACAALAVTFSSLNTKAYGLSYVNLLDDDTPMTIHGTPASPGFALRQGAMVVPSAKDLYRVNLQPRRRNAGHPPVRRLMRSNGCRMGM